MVAGDGHLINLSFQILGIGEGKQVFKINFLFFLEKGGVWLKSTQPILYFILFINILN